MNLHLPQTEEAKAEALILMAVSLFNLRDTGTEYRYCMRSKLFSDKPNLA